MWSEEESDDEKKTNEIIFTFIIALEALFYICFFFFLSSFCVSVFKWIHNLLNYLCALGNDLFGENV